SWAANAIATALCVGCWGYFLYQGVIDPLGGINTLWPLFGIANQMLAAIALTVCCVILIRMKRDRYLWVPLLPTVWLVICTLTAGWQKVFDDNIRIGFLSHAAKYSDALAQGQIIAPAKSLDEMHRIITNDYVNSGLSMLFMAIVVIVIVFGIRTAMMARRIATPTASETPYVALPSLAS
ncbi:MAG: carbon starvation CstA 5TM domain-containing protein, partial [Dokdonella sp.]